MASKNILKQKENTVKEIIEKLDNSKTFLLFLQKRDELLHPLFFRYNYFN